MKKVLGLIVVLCLAFIGTIFYIGTSAQKKTEGDLNRVALWLAANAPEVKITDRTYKKGLFSADSSFSISVAGDPDVIMKRLACGAMRDTKAFSSLKTTRFDAFCKKFVGSTLGVEQSNTTPLTLAVNTSIQHGPWLGGTEFGRASSKTRFAVTSNPMGETNAYLKTWLDGVVLNSVEGFGSDLKNHLSIPAFDRALLEGTAKGGQDIYKMNGINVYMNTESSRKFVNFKIETLGSESSTQGLFGRESMTMGKQVWVIGNRPVNGSIEEWLFSGTSTGTTSDIQMSMLGQTVGCKNMGWDSVGKLNNSLYDNNLKLSFDCAVTVEADTIPWQGVLDWNISKINVTALMGMVQELLETGPSEEIVFNKMAEMTRSTPTFSGNTTLSLNGKRVMAGTHQVEYKEITADNMRNFMATEMLKSIAANISVVLYPQDIMNAAPDARKASVMQMLTQLESGEIFVRNNDELKFNFAIKEGKVLLNGKEQPL